MIEKIRSVYYEYPGQFWLLAGASFIDMVGGYLIFPFFSLYFTEKFDVGLIQVGYAFAVWGLAGVLGQTIGGVLADKMGRKILVIAGLIFSAITSLAFIYVETYEMVYIVAAIGGFFADSASPARQAMVADLLPEDQLTEGYSIMGAIESAAMSIGPALGGLLASVSFALLFYIDVITSGIAAIIIALYLLETQNKAVAEKNKEQSMGEVFRGYGQVLSDKWLLVILFIMGFVFIVDEQLYFSVPVFMRDIHNMPPYYYGSLMGIASFLAVVVQFPLTRKLRRFSFLTIMAGGTLLYAVGFGLFSFVSGYPMFLLAFVIIGLAQILYFPTSHAIVGKLAPEEMRGRYMAVFGIVWTVQVMTAPLLAGYLIDTHGPTSIWTLAAIVLPVVAIGKLLMQARLPKDSPIKAQ